MPHKIELYGVIGFSWDDADAKTIARKLRDIEADEETDNDIELHINSGGGFVDDAVAIVNRLRMHPGQVHVIIDGLAASAATLIAFGGGDLVEMPNNATVMIHNPWSIAAGDAEDMRDVADMLDLVTNNMIAVYRSKAPDLDETELRAMLDAETWMGADDAHDLGFVDVVTRLDESEDDDAAAALRELAVSQYVAACADSDRLPRYTHAPLWAQHLLAPSTSTAHENHARPRATQQTESDAMADKKTTKPNAPTTPNASTPAAPVVDVAQREADARAAEQTRIAGIIDLCEAHDVDGATRATMISKGVTVEAAGLQILASIADRQQSDGAGAIVAAIPGGDADEKRATAIERALLALAGALPADEEKAERGNPYRSYSLRMMAMEFAPRGLSVEAGLRHVFNAARPFEGSARADIGAPHTTGDFPNLLANVAWKSMLRGWEESPETFEAWTNRGSLNDYKIAQRVGMNLAPDLLQVGEGAEYQGGAITDRGVPIQLGKYGRLFAISREAILNDDLSAFTRVPMKMGRAARRLVGDLVYAIISTNAVIYDGNPLFDALHSNEQGAGVDIDNDGYSQLEAAMRTQQDPDSLSALNVSPRYMLVPARRMQQARTLLEASTINNTTNTLVGVVDPIVEPRLDAASEDNWHLIADPNMFDTLEVAYLNGNPAPSLEQMDGWKVDGTEFKVRMEVGVAVLDFRSFQRGTATPFP